MAIPSTTWFEVQTGGSDTLNGGGFDTASTGKPTDLTCTTNTGTTSTPEVSSASYNFVAGDVGNWLYIQAGTNWTPGWYKITSVAANKATVNAAIGVVVLSNGTLSTVVGVATVGTPTAGTWAVDYSQQAAVQFSLTGVTTSAANAILLMSSATKAMVGNVVQITGGTNFTVGFYCIIAATAGTSLTVDRICTSAAGSAGTVGIGGALASPGKAGSVAVNGNSIWAKAGTYTITSATANMAGGCLTVPGSTGGAQVGRLSGYGTTRGDLGTRPLFQASGISTFSLVALSTAGAFVENIECDGAGLTSSRGFNLNSSGAYLYQCKASNCTNNGFLASSTSQFAFYCEATGCSALPAFSTISCYFCRAYANTIVGFSGSNALSWCLSYNNTGASSDGFNMTDAGIYDNLTAYGNGRDGFRALTSLTNRLGLFANCIAVNNSGYGFNNANGAMTMTRLFNCAGYNNTSGNVATANIIYPLLGFQALSADPFVSASSGNFALNNTAGAGAACRAAGIPGAFPGGLSTGYLDIGTVQHADPSSPIGRPVVIQNIGTY